MGRVYFEVSRKCTPTWEMCRVITCLMWLRLKGSDFPIFCRVAVSADADGVLFRESRRGLDVHILISPTCLSVVLLESNDRFGNAGEYLEAYRSSDVNETSAR